MAIRTIEWRNGAVVMLDQRLLPAREVYRVYRDYRDVAKAIETMVIRGAPAIGVAAGMGIALGAAQASDGKLGAAFERLCRRFEKTRPTAVNLFWAIERMRLAFARHRNERPEAIRRALVAEALAIRKEDIEANRALGAHGAPLVPKSGTVLTHCNAGALATAGYGTALGVIRAACERAHKIDVIATETRPFLQGARLTAWELKKDRIPVTLVTDSTVGLLMQQGKIQCVVVGTDRTAANGDVVNKIGTYTVAVLAKRHGVPFYVAAPTSSIDLRCRTGRDIPIEQRSAREVTHLGDRQIAPRGVKAVNPAFDLTPHELVTAIITENGIARPPYRKSLARLARASASKAPGSRAL